ncbi:MAG: AbrB/MazE/SpoVT family DNA-binding domain-containing protein [Thiotrichales bacterium]
MTEAVLDIKRWGNSLGMRLPSAVAKAANLHVDQRVRLIVEDGRVVIIPVERHMDSLEQRLSRFDPEKHGGEVMQTDEWVGAERW